MDRQATDIDLLGPLRETAQADPDSTALKARDRGAASYAQMLASVDACVAALRAEGVASHSRVATILPNAPETAVAILAIASFATVVPLNPAYPPDEMRSLLARARVSHILSSAETIARTGLTEANPRSASSLWRATGRVRQAHLSCNGFGRVSARTRPMQARRARRWCCIRRARRVRRSASR